MTSQFVKMRRLVPALLALFALWAAATPARAEYPERPIKVYGIEMSHVAYKGSPQAMSALLANEIQVFLIGLTVGASHVPTGRLRPLAVTSLTGLKGAPDVPTMAELGRPDLTMANAWSLSVPARTPQDVVAKLNKAMRDAVADSAVQARFLDNGMIPRGGTALEATAEMEENFQKWGALIRQRNIRAE